ncbi:MAG TPA: class C beta-lactamase-related serine hydrolase, partial [Gammaproteobacteria bacterium]|nr:class C beta-lactamase-related serine hydrolase [Gammaproteobacteria bacterium]
MTKRPMQGFPVAKENRIPRDRWDRPPWNRWSFQHIREILPTTEVWRGSGPSWQIPEHPLDLGQIKFSDHRGEKTCVANWLTNNYADGITVIHHGEMCYERYFNNMTERTVHLSQSMAKSITSAVTGILVGRGLLDPQESITTYLPELKRTAWKDAQLRHALDMTSGVRYNEDYEAPDSDIAATDIASGWRKPHRKVRNFQCIWDQILSLKQLTRPHGELFEYRSIETDVLAHCMERVTRTRLAELVSRELWQPLGAQEDACFTVDSAGYPLADGGFNATLRDYSRFGQMLCNGGIGNGKQIVPIEWLNDTFNANPEIFGEPYNDGLQNGAYRNQFWIRDVDRKVMMARGVFGQLIYVDIDHQLTIT